MPRSFWDNIFGNLTAAEPLPPPLVLDERINPPTPTERQGLMAEIAGTQWNNYDPIALLGMNSNVVDWGQQVPRQDLERGVLGEYFSPRYAGGDARPDTIRFRQATPERGAPNAWLGETLPARPAQPGIAGRSDFANIGTHEFRHRGFNMLNAMGADAGPYGSLARYWQSETPNIMEDRRVGYEGSYAGIHFDDDAYALYNEMLMRLRSQANDAVAARLRWLDEHPGMTWSDAP